MTLATLIPEQAPAPLDMPLTLRYAVERVQGMCARVLPGTTVRVDWTPLPASGLQAVVTVYCDDERDHVTGCRGGLTLGAIRTDRVACTAPDGEVDGVLVIRSTGKTHVIDGCRVRVLVVTERRAPELIDLTEMSPEGRDERLACLPDPDPTRTARVQVDRWVIQVTTSHPLELDPDGAYVLAVALYDLCDIPEDDWDLIDGLTGSERGEFIALEREANR